jgi:hypothetical protein
MNKKRRLATGDVASDMAALGKSSTPSPVGSHHHHRHHLKRKNDSRDAAGDAILASMTNIQLRSTDKFVVACTLAMLATIFEEKDEYRSLACHELGTSFSIVHAMKTHADCPRIQYLGCQSLSLLLCSLTTAAGDKNKDRNNSQVICGMEVVLSAMRHFANDTNIQVAACTYLGRLLCSSTPDVTEYLLSKQA